MMKPVNNTTRMQSTTINLSNNMGAAGNSGGGGGGYNLIRDVSSIVSHNPANIPDNDYVAIFTNNNQDSD